MRKQKLLVIGLFIIAFMWIMHTLSKNFMVDPDFEKFLNNKDEIISNPTVWAVMLRIHIILAVIALLTGPVGMMKSLRNKRLPFHRFNGRIYIFSIVLNFIPGVYVSLFATGGWLSTFGFLILNTLWLITTTLGYKSIKRKDIVRHSQWITRSFFLTFANTIIYIIVAVTHNGLNLSYGLLYYCCVAMLDY
ncbi:DUF2306 domain-containing protein [Lysinibacillus sphaericus]|uniref:DUF2306 domain-containing protein n=1 Tax=Lysinibacillus sphaericus OT4b.31 TaxID=1285586 RepID=R7Z984_LYSSH|nr:DUF2306 domain-containing protein [Lysinibacillus sphaericus]EON70692.1 hypothetical protein H131_20192 [Lysinibacillus sphaericus OT4b.31]